MATEEVSMKTTETLFQVPHVSLQNVRYGVEGVEYGKKLKSRGKYRI